MFSTTTFSHVRYETSSSSISGYSDIVSGSVYLSLCFAKMTWDETQTVTLVGIDDVLDNGNSWFNLSVPVSYDGGDNFNSTYASYGSVSFQSVDDDEADLVVETEGYNVSEPYHGDEMTIYVYPTTEVYGIIIVGFIPSIVMVLISPDSLTDSESNYGMGEFVIVTSNDNFDEDQDMEFDILVEVISTEDENYEGIRNTVSGERIGDPEDENVSLEIEVLSDSFLWMSSTPDSIYSIPFVTEEGGTLEFHISLPYPPQSTVIVYAITSVPHEAVVVCPSLLFFNDVNYN